MSLVDRTDFLTALAGEVPMLRDLLGDVSAETESMLQHSNFIDYERVFSRRLLRIGVGSPPPQPTMDQNGYATNLDYVDVTIQDLLEEFAHLRQSSVL